MALFSSALLSGFAASAAMRHILSDRARIQRMLDFELALARAQAAVGMVPALALDAIAHAARAEHFDAAALAKEAIACGDIAEPLVRALAAQVAEVDLSAAPYVHQGSSSHDLLDSGLVLDLKAAVDQLIADLGTAIDSFMKLTGRHRRTMGVSRPYLQHALPIPFGLKLASYASALGRSRERLRRLRRESLVLQFGGAVGTLDALGDRGPEIAERLAALLDLPLPEAPWHTHRDRLAELAAAIAILAGTCGKIARDVSLLMQTDVGEVFAVPSASSTTGSRPDGRMAAAIAADIAAATLANSLVTTILTAQMHEHERGLGSWQAEWLSLPALALLASGALAAVIDIANGLEVDAERMRTNVALMRGLNMRDAVAFALAQKLGKENAYRILEEASRKAAIGKRDLQDVLREDETISANLSAGELAKLFEPLAHQGAAQVFIDRIAGSLHGRTIKR
jgi:3-carboxy-cis,cis-muconate cycloisomerase